jgi:cell division GTPase FtsZ
MARANEKIEKKLTPPTSGVVVLGFVFAGGCGTNNARRFMASVAPEEFPYLFILVMNTDGPQLKEFFDPAAVNYDLDEAERSNLSKWIASMESTRQLTIFELGESGSGAGGDPEIGRKATEAKREEIEQWMLPLRTVILSGGAGKGTGSGALPVIQKIANGLDKCPLAIVTMPFAYEGRGRMKKAVACLKTLYEQGPTMPIYNENVPKEFSQGKGFKVVFDEINNASLLPVFFGIREVTQVVGDMQNVDIADWRKVLSVGNYVTCDYTRLNVVKGGDDETLEEDLKVFIQRLLRQDPYQDHRTRRNATGMLAWAHGAWKPDEVRSVIKVATDEISPEVADDLEVFPGIHVGTDGTKWMMILSVASQGPDINVAYLEEGVASTTESRTATIYISVEGQTAPAEVKVRPEVAERWKFLYRRRYGELTVAERQEYGRLAVAISSQTGKTVFLPKD